MKEVRKDIGNNVELELNIGSTNYLFEQDNPFYDLDNVLEIIFDPIGEIIESQLLISPKLT